MMVQVEHLFCAVQQTTVHAAPFASPTIDILYELEFNSNLNFHGRAEQSIHHTYPSLPFPSLPLNHPLIIFSLLSARLHYYFFFSPSTQKVIHLLHTRKSYSQSFSFNLKYISFFEEKGRWNSALSLMSMHDACTIY